MANTAMLRMKYLDFLHLELLQSSLKIKLKAHSQLSKIFVDKFCSLSFCAFNDLNQEY